jgi:hypothetical protein
MPITVFIPHAIETMQRLIDAAGPAAPAQPETRRELRRQRRAARRR